MADNAATALDEAMKCLYAAAILADSFGKPATAAKFRAAREGLETLKEAESNGD